MRKKMLTDWVCIARTGTHTDANGKPHTFTESDFDALKAGYNPANQEAALCFGHPKDSDPAFGWVHALKRTGGNLFAQFADVPAEVKKMVQDGRYKHVSISLSPDKKRLLHVGLLGAAAPAMEGLGTVSFNEASGVTINFSAPEQQADNGGKMDTEALQKHIIELQQQIATLKAENEKLQADKDKADKDKSDAETKATEVAAEFSAFKETLTTKQRQERVRALVNSGKLEPAKEEETVSFASALSTITEPVNFSSSSGETEQITVEERYFRELEARESTPLAVNFSTQANAPAHAVSNDSGTKVTVTNVGSYL